eukprot:3352911-Prymnesium_polylepis.1
MVSTPSASARRRAPPSSPKRGSRCSFGRAGASTGWNARSRKRSGDRDSGIVYNFFSGGLQ